MAADMFLKIKGIDGESTDHAHKGEMEIESWSWGETNTGSSSHGSGAGSGKVHMQDFHFTITMGKHTPKLFLACAVGDHISEATLICRKAGGEQQEFLKIKFTDILISSYQIGHHSGSDGLPTDQCSFNYTKIQIDYKEQKPDGSLGGAIPAGYDLKANKKV